MLVKEAMQGSCGALFVHFTFLDVLHVGNTHENLHEFVPHQGPVQIEFTSSGTGSSSLGIIVFLEVHCREEAIDLGTLQQFILYLRHLSDLRELIVCELGWVATISDSPSSELFQLFPVIANETLHIVLILRILDKPMDFPMVKIVLQASLNHVTRVLSPVGKD